jgi:hypothetical protein
MALTVTTLAAAATRDTLRFNVTSSTGATVGGFMRIDKEYCQIVAIPQSGYIDVRSRGDRGGTAAAHGVLAPVTFGLAEDMQTLGEGMDIPVPGFAWDIKNVGADGAIACPAKNTIFNINKATALGSSTFADPRADQDGLVVQFVTTTDALHVLTTVNLHDGTTGAHTTVTSAGAFRGNCLMLIALGGKWSVLANNGFTIT